MAGNARPEGPILDVVWLADDDRGRPVALVFLALGYKATDIEPLHGGELLGHWSINNGIVAKLAFPDSDSFALLYNGTSVHFEPAKTEPVLMAGRNAIATSRNGESVETVLDWLDYHHRRQNVTGAVIIDRVRPAADDPFEQDLMHGLTDLGHDLRVVLLRAGHPLGAPDLPPEVHPFCAPAAPGKDRMEVPPADPWTSPLAAMHIYELMRYRFLSAARAVANIDLCDLLYDAPENNVFDRVQATDQGALSLTGQACYPWRVRSGQPIRFGDHICTQFDTSSMFNRWCVAPGRTAPDAIWRLVRIGHSRGAAVRPGQFMRHLNLKHPVDAVSRIVPKTALVEDQALLAMSRKHFGHNPVRIPKAKTMRPQDKNGQRVIVTTMKNEGPFILEWLAYHRSIGFDDFLIYTNDCTDGTDTMLSLLQRKGLLQHRENPFREMKMKPQHAALHATDSEDMIRDAAWITCIDVDEFVNVKAGDGTLDALFQAAPDANMISMTWRLFGNGDVHGFEDRFVTEQFHQCAEELTRKPHQAWGFKTLFQNNGIFKKMGVHRPKGLKPQLQNQIRWINGSGRPLPQTMYRNAWRSTASTYGYDLVQLNHYAVRSVESFLVKRDRGRVNHVDRDQGLAYWFRMNNNATEDRSILRHIPRAREEFKHLVADPDIRAAHAASVARHREKITELMAQPSYQKLYAELAGSRMQKLSRLHAHFGANVFLQGPEVVPDDVADQEPGADFFFTVDTGQTQH